MKDSRPIIGHNQISANEGIGLFIRDKSGGKAYKNEIKTNNITLFVETYQKSLDNIKHEN